MLLITPAAYHRLVERGEETEHFHRFASKVLVAALVPLALGMAGDVYVVVQKVTESLLVSVVSALVVLAVFWACGRVGRRPVMRRAGLLLAKDVRLLGRAKLLVAAVLVYPLLVAVLIGLVAGYATSRPRVALVDLDRLPETLELGGQTLDLDRLIERVAGEVRLVRLDGAEARRQLETGRVVATVTVPEGFAADLRGMIRSPRLVLRTAGGGLSSRVSREVQALVYALNRRLQRRTSSRTSRTSGC